MDNMVFGVGSLLHACTDVQASYSARKCKHHTAGWPGRLPRQSARTLVTPPLLLLFFRGEVAIHDTASSRKLRHRPRSVTASDLYMQAASGSMPHLAIIIFTNSS